MDFEQLVESEKENLDFTDTFVLKPGHLIALQKVATGLHSRKGPIFAEYEKATASPCNQRVVNNLKSEMIKALDLAYPTEPVTVVTSTLQGVEFPLLVCFYCQKQLRPYLRKNKKGKAVRLDISGYKRHIVAHRLKAILKEI